MADFGSEELPPLKGHKFSIVTLHLTVMLINAVNYLHKGGVAVTKFWVHVFKDGPSILTSACAAAFLDRHLVRPQSLQMQRLERLHRGIYYLHQRDATAGEIPSSDEFLASTSFLECTSDNASEVEREYERILEHLASGPEAFYGLNLDPKGPTARLRLKDFPLYVRSALNPHLGRSPGINVPSLYAGLKGSCSAMHCEDGDLDSGNIHRFTLVFLFSLLYFVEKAVRAIAPPARQPRLVAIVRPFAWAPGPLPGFDVALGPIRPIVTVGRGGFRAEDLQLRRPHLPGREVVRQAPLFLEEDEVPLRPPRTFPRSHL
ncbi:hypothetical protein QAD02_008984 [Eretmocerus hayati]|uniref:Uncharacterized protein n=1 Tax=Eretmocerus hayati TaxID=131215 RepID=A0ACC2N849_9HYME|nr:hypothetical protein QAD02_008984 [Eretmocerus hayati]